MYSRILKSSLWFSALICLAAGAYVALTSTQQFFYAFNYLLGPVGDGATDTARVIFPVITGDQPWTKLLEPFADHRIFIERLIIIYDFVFHHGIEEAHPLRMAAVFWAILILFSAVVFANKKLPLVSKCLLSGCGGVLVFARVSLTNFDMPITFTWPMVLLFALFSFITTERYCAAIEKRSTLTAKFYLILTALFVLLNLYTFNIGLILWPVIFIVLLKRRVFFANATLWASLAVLMYAFYFWSGWHPGITATDGGMKHSLFNPIHPFLYFSRIVSIPMVSTAIITASLATILIGISIICLSLYCINRFWRLYRWSASETIVFASLLFSFLTLLIIPVMRAWIEAEYVVVGLRFTAISFFLYLSLLASLFIFRYQVPRKHTTLTDSLLAIMIAVWLVGLFIPSDTYLYRPSRYNPYFIALSTGIPINPALAHYFDFSDSAVNLQNLAFNDAIQKKYHHGAYFLWPTQEMNQHFREVHAAVAPCEFAMTHEIRADLRAKGSAMLVVETQLSLAKSPSQWSLLFTNQQNKLIGYSLPLLVKRGQSQTWQGAVNTMLLHGRYVNAWLFNREKNQICAGGKIKV